MRNNIIKISLFTFLILSAGCVVQKSVAPVAETPRVKNIIFFIGDGMGTAQVYAGMTASNTPFYLERFPYSGFSKTYSADNYVTDSAAGGTALATGEKTKNGMIGMGPDSTVVQSVIAIASKNGLATGVLSTSAITHATTPASFVAHNAGRGNYEEIALDFIKGIPDVFIGGGKAHFDEREDGRDLTTELKSLGYDVVYSLEDLKRSGSDRIAGLLSKEHMPRVTEGRTGVLKEMTAKAIETLSRDKDGFFLMVEGSMIDWGGHDRDKDYTITEMIDLDEAIGVAYDFARSNGETLIVVTADHETGGMSLPAGDIKGKRVAAAFIESGNHTAVMVPVFSYGPAAERFSGIHDNTFFFGEFLKLLNIR
jgi:alkaline phosphatase